MGEDEQVVRNFSPTSVFDSRTSSLNSNAGDDLFHQFWGSANGSRGGGDEVAMAPRTPSIDDLLRDSVESFHREGPLVNPLETKHNQLTGEAVKNLSMVDRMKFVCEVKGFDYAIHWKYTTDRKSVTYASSVTVEAGRNSLKEDGSSNIGLFLNTSISMFTSWVMGFGMPGRVGYTGNYEWHEEVTQLPAWSFQRLRQARHASLRTIVGIPVQNGVIELGSTKYQPHNLQTVQYVQKICADGL